MSIISLSREYAIACHSGTNHLYDGKPYDIHLQMVYAYGEKYKHLIVDKYQEIVLAACWTHDLIEDCRQTYNDVKAKCGVEIAEITYALTNEKGKNRKERANDKYYEGIRNTPGAVYVKICDRLANVSYSAEHKSSMLEVYRKEYSNFEDQLWVVEYKDMFFKFQNLLLS